jgi:hypothetical protein
MTAADYAAYRDEVYAAIRSAHLRLAVAHAAVEVPPAERLRPAVAADIVPGAAVYYRPAGCDPYWKLVDEVRRPDDAFKAYVAEDGCRYGLEGAMVEVGGEA